MSWKLSQRVRGAAGAGAVQFEPHSVEQYASMWGRFCAWMQTASAPRPPLKVDEVTTQHVEVFLASLRGGRKGDRPVATSTSRRYLFLLHRTFDHLVGLGVVEVNPCVDLPQLRGHQAPPRPARTLLLPQHERAFVGWTLAQPTTRWDWARNRALRMVFLGSGITVSEARGLRVQDIHFGDASELVPADAVIDQLIELAAAERTDGDPTPADAQGPTASAREPATGRQICAHLSIPGHGITPARTALLAPWAVEALMTWLRVREQEKAPGEMVFNTRGMVQGAVAPDEETSGGDNAGKAVGTDEAEGIEADQVDVSAWTRPAAASLSSEEIYDVVCAALRECGFRGPRAGPATLRNTYMARQIKLGVPLERIRDWVGLQTIEQLRVLERQIPMRVDDIAPR